MSYVYDQHVFHYIVENGIIYMCMADDVSRRRVPFAFLEDIKTKFQQDYGQSVSVFLMLKYKRIYHSLYQHDIYI